MLKLVSNMFVRHASMYHITKERMDKKGGGLVCITPEINSRTVRFENYTGHKFMSLSSVFVLYRHIVKGSKVSKKMVLNMS